MDRPVVPFYFPTTVVIVDDDDKFARYFSLLLPDWIHSICFNSAADALDYINSQTTIDALIANLFNTDETESLDEHLIVKLDGLRQNLYDLSRFSLTSLVIVDYAMPEKNGIDFCKEIKDKNIKKLLLTGRANDETAIKAFNEGYVDRFYIKRDKDIDKIVSSIIGKMQYEYFQEASTPISNVLVAKVSPYLHEPEFRKFFYNLFKSGRWVEYSVCNNPQGILLIDSTGQSDFLIVHSMDELKTQYDIALSSSAPEQLLVLLEKQKTISWFPSQDGYYTSDCENWRDYVFPAELSFGNNKKYLCSLLSPTPANVFSSGSLRTYSEFLQDFSN